MIAVEPCFHSHWKGEDLFFSFLFIYLFLIDLCFTHSVWSAGLLAVHPQILEITFRYKMLFFFFFFVIWTISNLFIPWRFQTVAWRTTAYPCWTRRWMIRETQQASAAGVASTLWAAATSSRKAWPCHDSSLSALDRCSTTAMHARSWCCQLLTTTSWRSMPHDPGDSVTNNLHVGLNLWPGWTLLRLF